MEEAGYAAVSCSTGAAALKELHKDAARFKAVLTDIRLGKPPSGWDVARVARELVPGIPVVYMTGDSAAEWTAQGVPESVLVQKPYALSQIIVALAQLINAVPPTLEPTSNP